MLTGPFEGDPLAPSAERTDTVVERVDDPERLVVGHVVGPEVVFGDGNDPGGGVRQALGPVGRIVVMRRDGPQAVAVGHLEGGSSGGVFVELDHFEGGGGLRVGELGEEGLTDIEECVWCGAPRSSQQRQGDEDDRRTTEYRGFL